MRGLQEKVAIITGGADGIGKATALRLAREGCKIGILDLPEQSERGAAVVATIIGNGGSARCINCDVSDPNGVAGAIREVVRIFGRLDIVIANAGVNGVWAPIEELSPTEWNKTIAINLGGTFLTVRYAIPYLRDVGEGSIVIVSSVNGTRTFSTAGSAAYSTSKAAQVAFTKMAALELAQYGIRVNCVLPGAIDTNINQRTTKRHTSEVEIKVNIPSGRPGINHGKGTPDEVADVCLFFASTQSRHVSGTELFVDGGGSLFI